MRTSPDEIDRATGEESQDVEQNQGFLELQNGSDVRRYGRIVVIGVAVLALAGAGYLVYRRVKRPMLSKRLRTRVLDSFRDFQPELQSRLMRQIQRV